MAELFAVIALLMLLLACGGETAKDVGIPDDIHEKPIWRSSSVKPDWTLQKPAVIGASLTIVGLSEEYDLEKDARKDAIKNCRSGTVEFVGTLVEEKVEQARLNHGLGNDVINPTAVVRAFKKLLSQNIPEKLTASQWYEEKWYTHTGLKWKIYVQVHVPMKVIDTTYREIMAEMARQEDLKAHETKDAVAKSQADQTAEFWEQMRKQGFSE